MRAASHNAWTGVQMLSVGFVTVSLRKSICMA